MLPRIVVTRILQEPEFSVCSVQIPRSARNSMTYTDRSRARYTLPELLRGGL